MFSGSIAAIVTPMHPDGSIDWPGWERLLALHLQAGTRGLVIGGTTGESVSLSDGEVIELMARARAQLRGRVPLIAGAGGSSTATTVERAARLSASGADALLVVTPPYVKPTQEGLYRHFQAVAAASSAPIVLYNVPTRTAVDLLPETVARLAQLPRVVAVKEAVGQMSRVRELIHVTGGGFTVLSGDRAATERIDARLRALHAALFSEPNPIPVKWALADLGLIDRGIRLPLTELSEALRPRLRTVVAQALDAAAVAPAKLA